MVHPGARYPRGQRRTPRSARVGGSGVAYQETHFSNVGTRFWSARTTMHIVAPIIAAIVRCMICRSRHTDKPVTSRSGGHGSGITRSRHGGSMVTSRGQDSHVPGISWTRRRDTAVTSQGHVTGITWPRHKDKAFTSQG
eukprot:748963-Rhodomonas_salina.3